MKQVCYTLTFMLLLQLIPASAQSLDTSWKQEFTEHVKSTDEFMKRFNGEEAYPGLSPTDENFMKLNLFSLLDFNMKPAKKQEALQFVSTIMSKHVTLHYADTLWYAVAKCEVGYKGQTKQVTLVLRTEKIRDNRYRWAICGADGIGQLVDLNSKSAISPVEHEIHFMELQSIFRNDSQHAFGYRGSDCPVDQLSVLLTLAYAGQIEFKEVTDLKFVFLQVPDYVFYVEEAVRRGSNAGWLISTFESMAESNKHEFIQKLLGR